MVLARPIDEALVRELLEEQHPDLAGLSIAPAGAGWDNAVFRLGDRLAVRMPRRVESVPLIAHEQQWLPVLEEHLPLPVPVPLRVGVAGCGYPWRWSVCPWLPGHAATVAPLTDPAAAARRLGAFLGALHQPAPADAPRNPYRGIPLLDRSPRFRHAADEVRGSGRLDHSVMDRLVVRWEELVPSPRWPGPPLWLHGDLHPANLLVDQGELVAVIDFGDVSCGDPATDLAVAWMLFERPERDLLRAAVGTVDDATWLRAEAWALALAVAYLDGSPDGSPMVEVAQHTIRAVLSVSPP